MKERDRKLIGVAILSIVIIVIMVVLFPSREEPNVVFVNKDKILLDFEGTGKKAFVVNVENMEDRTIDGITVVTKLHNPDPEFIKVLTPTVEIDSLERKARSGEKDVEFLVLKTTGDVITFRGNSTVIVDGLKLSVKEFEITIKPPSNQ